MRYVTLKVDICHLPLEEVSHKLLPLLTLNTSWKEFKVEIRSEVVCVLGKTGRTGLQTVRCFPGKILWVHFLHLLLSRKALKSFMWCLLLVTSGNLHETSDYLLKECALDCVYSPFTTISYILTSPPPTSLVQFLRAIWNAASRAIVLILPPIKLDSQLSYCAFFSEDSCKRNKFVLYVSHCVLGSFCHSCLIFTLNNTGPT